MTPSKDPRTVVDSLAEQLSAPLAAARYALYLAACRCGDDSAIAYLELADREISAINAALRCAAQPAGEGIHLVPSATAA